MAGAAGQTQVHSRQKLALQGNSSLGARETRSVGTSDSGVPTKPEALARVAITGISAANPCVITATIAVKVGDRVRLTGIIGASTGNNPLNTKRHLDMARLNGVSYLVTAVSSAGTSFTIGSLNTINYTAYGSIGEVQRIPRSAPSGTEGFYPGD